MFHFENLSDDSNQSALQVAQESTSDRVPLISQNQEVQLSESDSESVTQELQLNDSEDKDVIIRRLQAENAMLKEQLQSQQNNSDDDIGGEGSARKPLNELSEGWKGRLTGKIQKDIKNLAEKRGTSVQSIAANIIHRFVQYVLHILYIVHTYWVTRIICHGLTRIICPLPHYESEYTRKARYDIKRLYPKKFG